MTYYIVEIQYVGPNRRDDQFADAHRIEIRTAPALTNMTGQPCTDGWCGTTGDWAVYGHGEYPTIEAAREAIEVKFGPCREDEGVSPAEDVVETYRPGRYVPYGRDATRSWCHDSVQAEVTADTTPDQIDALIASLEESAQITAGATLDLDEVRAMIDERLAELRAEGAVSAPPVWQPLRDVIAEAIYMDPSDFAPDGAENWPRRLDFPHWNELSEEKREQWRKDADRVIAVLAAPVGCTPRMEAAAKTLGVANAADVLAAMMRAEGQS